MCLGVSFNEGLFFAGTFILIVVSFVASGRILDLLVLALFVLLFYGFLRFILPLIAMAVFEGCPAVQQELLDCWYSLMNPFRQLIGLPALEHRIQEEQPLPPPVSPLLSQSSLPLQLSPQPSSSPRRRRPLLRRSPSSSRSSPPLTQPPVTPPPSPR